MNMKATNIASKNFKKKPSCLQADPPKAKQKGGDKFEDLKSKLEREKETMKKTGRRFRQDTSRSSSAANIDLTIQSGTNAQNSNQCDISVGPDALVKENISLCDISISEPDDGESLVRSSRVFEREVKQQKKRNEEILAFLQKLDMADFTESLISLGYDDLETLAEVTPEDLNHVMMRARQQDRLIQSLKKLNLREEKTAESMSSSQITESKRWRIKTEASQRSTHREFMPAAKKSQTVKILERLRTQSRGEGRSSSQLGNGSMMMGNSFLYTVGSRNWGVQDQIRRACSSCFRVEKQMEMKGDCYYCSGCYKYVAEDLLTISLQRSMSRSYGANRK